MTTVTAEHYRPMNCLLAYNIHSVVMSTVVKIWRVENYNVMKLLDFWITEMSIRTDATHQLEWHSVP